MKKMIMVFLCFSFVTSTIYAQNPMADLINLGETEIIENKEENLEPTPEEIADLAADSLAAIGAIDALHQTPIENEKDELLTAYQAKLTLLNTEYDQNIQPKALVKRGSDDEEAEFRNLTRNELVNIRSRFTSNLVTESRLYYTALRKTVVDAYDGQIKALNNVIYEEKDSYRKKVMKEYATPLIKQLKNAKKKELGVIHQEQESTKEYISCLRKMKIEKIPEKTGYKFAKSEC